eukprot:TRINITY_DN852_c0_g1_i1.p1 TRINITY_DN852_c0_g1~~TRINITY_DN852_c0_g1_i1.p1  ORF type:complete len:286 (-),score=29.96 TRINITY_DN852_c0_g1_i1:161-1018(-)
MSTSTHVLRHCACAATVLRTGTKRTITSSVARDATFSGVGGGRTAATRDAHSRLSSFHRLPFSSSSTSSSMRETLMTSLQQQSFRHAQQLSPSGGTSVVFRRAIHSTCALRDSEKKKRDLRGLQQKADGPSDIQIKIYTAAKVAQETGYSLVFIGGVVLVGTLLVYMTKDWILPSGYYNLYSKSLKLVKDDPDVISILGAGLKAHGRRTRRGHHAGIHHSEYQNEDGDTCMRLKYKLKGNREVTATVYVDYIKKDNTGPYQFQYLLVDVPQTGQRVTLYRNGQRL